MLRAHLAIIGAGGHDPVATLAAAIHSRELETAADPAAVLDWRLDPTGGRNVGPGPLPWLPTIPTTLANDTQYGPYLNARANLIHALVVDVRAEAAGYGPTTAPPWAMHLMDPAHQQLVGNLAVWRAATGVPTQDRRPTGAPQLGAAAARVQHDLETRTAAIQGDPRSAAREWAPLVALLGLDVSRDPYWPELAGRLSSLARVGLDVAGMLTVAAAEKPLPDEQGAAALWWRLSRHLPQAAVTATGASGSGWQLQQLLGDIQADNHAGHGQPVPAADLAYRLRAASQTCNESEPTVAADQPRHSAGGRIASAQKEIRPSPRQPGGHGLSR